MSEVDYNKAVFVFECIFKYFIMSYNHYLVWFALLSIKDWLSDDVGFSNKSYFFVWESYICRDLRSLYPC